MLSEDSLQRMRGVALCHLEAVGRQVGTSRPSPAPLLLEGPLSQQGSPPWEKNPGLGLKAGRVLLAFSSQRYL